MFNPKLNDAPQTFQNISKIIEHVSKPNTYKFALLRGVIHSR
jgi:hypothetical protein